MNVKVGQRYRHYKGNAYQVVALAKHSETQEPLVIYQDLSDPNKVWARPKKMFLETIELDGRPLNRFELISL